MLAGITNQRCDRRSGLDRTPFSHDDFGRFLTFGCWLYTLTLRMLWLPVAFSLGCLSHGLACHSALVMALIPDASCSPLARLLTARFGHALPFPDTFAAFGACAFSFQFLLDFAVTANSSLCGADCYFCFSDVLGRHLRNGPSIRGLAFIFCVAPPAVTFPPRPLPLLSPH